MIRFYSIGWYVVPVHNVDVVLFLVTCSQLPPAQSGNNVFWFMIYIFMSMNRCNVMWVVLFKHIFAIVWRLPPTLLQEVPHLPSQIVKKVHWINETLKSFFLTFNLGLILLGLFWNTNTRNRQYLCSFGSYSIFGMNVISSRSFCCMPIADEQNGRNVVYSK